MYDIIRNIFKKELLFELIEKAPIIVLLLDKEGKIVYFNKFFQDISGYNLNETIGKEWFTTFIPENIRDKIREVFNSRLNNMPEYEVFQNEILSKNGELKTIKWYNFNVKTEGKLYLILSLGIDITDDIKKSEDLRKLRIAISQVENGVIMTDINGNITYANQFIEKLTGYKPEELIGKNPRIFKSDYYTTEVYEELWKLISSGESWEGYFYNKRKDGSLYWEKATITPIIEENKITGYIGIKHDYTETQNLIKALDNVANEFEEIVKKRTIELKNTVEELIKEKEARKKAEKLLVRSSKMEAIGSFASGIVHDIKNIVNAIKIYNELLNLENSIENIKNYSKEIENGINKIEDYLNSILKFGRSYDDEKTVIDINILIDTIYSFISKTIPKNIIIKKMLNKNNLLSKINKSEIEQVIINIIVNAKDAIDNKNGLIIIETDNTTLTKDKAIEINLEEGNYNIIRIMNNGPQIPQEIIDKIFDPFFTTKKEKGTGLGLSFSLNIINKHKGNIIVESKPELTLFTIYLPECKSIEC
ncbi:MAG TPA: PAS domain S-box protein [Spirochaetota bacterium]|nr:PAS domain S-box protein [Spirochaetota bacterium]HOM39188.1 PAS domain S-box protein [Spirochaetota bacterium]HPQ49223.1 PAS domain S-box protein [Spirochaetota bacterium]